jgi:ADP-heptose:LPS heptosyltransferase
MDSKLPFLFEGYRIPKAKKRLAMKAFDGFAGILTLGMKRNFAVSPVKKLLIANAGHLGDLVMTTAIFPALRAQFPDLEIGILTGSWSRSVLAGHEDVSTVHVFDHVLLNRSSLSRKEKFKRHFETRKSALREIQAKGYDAVVDLRFNPGNFAQFLRKCRIPVRIGFTTGGSGPFLTHPRGMDESLVHVTERFFQLIEVLGVKAEHRGLMKTSIPAPAEEDLNEVREKIGPFEKLAVLHTGATDEFKNWTEDGWRTAMRSLLAAGYRVVLTGAGAEQKQLNQRLLEGIEGPLDLCDALSWREYVATISLADVVITLDTIAGHLAAALGRPSVTLMPGIIGYQWEPYGRTSISLTEKLPCVPCHRTTGCEGMECILGVKPEAVLSAVEDLRKP